MQLRAPETSAVAVGRVRAVVNPASGSVGPDAAAELSALLTDLGFEHRVIELIGAEPADLARAALEDDPDLVVVLGGDGTARMVAEMCGPDGPLVAPLPGGTMNKLGRALYGSRSWREALVETLARGAPHWIPGGEVAGRAFYCGALLGSPALLARAREAIRARELGLAWRRTVIASRKALRYCVSYELEGEAGRGAAISLLSPMVSRAAGAEDDGALRAAVLDPPEADAGATAGVRVTFSHLIGDWRDDPQITRPCHSGRAWARSPIPIMLDGEFFRMGREVEIRFRPRAFRALVPAGEGERDLTRTGAPPPALPGPRSARGRTRSPRR